MADRTVIRNADWVVAWDGAAGRHRYLRGADVAFTGNTIDHVGPGDGGPAAREIDSSGLMVMPGLVNIHCHPPGQPHFKGVREELSNPHHSGSGLYEMIAYLKPPADGRPHGARYSLCELLLSGVTSVLDISDPYDGWIDLLAESGIRAYAGAQFESARWGLKGGREITYDWDEVRARRDFDAALAVIDAADRHPSGRLAGAVCPATIDNVSAELLRDGHAAAAERGRPYQVHTAESVPQFNAITARYGMTPVQWARDLGILGPGSGIGHGIFLDHHSHVYWPSRDDLAILAETGTTVAHCPTVFSRYGHTLESFGRYRRAGVNIGLGTDTFPCNLIEEMRTVLILSKVADKNAFSTTLDEVFHAATVGGARALMREDIGRLAPGAKADLVLVDLTQPNMLPVRDPLRSLVFSAADRAVRDVYVDGVQIVRDHQVLTLDMAAAGAAIAEAQARMLAEVPTHDDRGRTAEDISPLTLPLGGSGDA